MDLAAPRFGGLGGLLHLRQLARVPVAEVALLGRVAVLLGAADQAAEVAKVAVLPGHVSGGRLLVLGQVRRLRAGGRSLALGLDASEVPVGPPVGTCVEGKEQVSDRLKEHTSHTN